MQCPQCHTENPAAAKFCNGCGAKLNFSCPQCAHVNLPGSRFCNECGAALSGKAKDAGPQTDRLRDTRPDAAERRQLTVMFCDLVGSTALSAQLDPEELREVIGAYQQTCAAVIQRYEGHIAQYLGDGLLVYFGYPAAHEDDAQRAVRAGLEIIAAMAKQVPSPPVGEGQGEGVVGVHGDTSLQVRLGIHTGPVVVGEIGSGAKREQLALGETPNVAARLQGLADPNTIVLSSATQRLVAGLFDCQDLGAQPLKGIATPLTLYRVLGASAAQSRLDAIMPTGLTPLVGREEELALLQRRWTQTTDREGQVVLLSGEPGIGKSRLVRELRERAEQDHAMRLEFRCSPYYQNSALYPIIEHLHRLLHWQKEDTPQTKLAKLHTTLACYRFPQADTQALFAALLSLPQPADAPPLNLSPQRQKQKTAEALIAWLVEEAERAPVYCAWEDVHWADPSTLELLGLLIDQTPTTRLFVLLTSRPEFVPPWGQHGHVSQLTLSRLGRRQVPQMIAQATRGKMLPADVVQQIVAKTDGVPLFVEELTKMIIESGLLTEMNGHYELRGPLPPLAIPSTLQDSLMARLDRLATTKEIAQVGATLGREFSYDVLRAVSPVEETMLQQGLRQLVQAELLYQRGTPPQATYLFKHALIQDTAYQSLLKSRRHQLHQQVAQVLEECFPETKDTQPELLAHHYTEAGLIAQAIPYWQQAGQRASQHSALVEAIAHLTKGLELLKALPDTSERTQQELDLHITLGPALTSTKGWAAPEVEKTYIRARELCQQVGATSQLFPVLWGLWVFYLNWGEIQTTHELAKQMLNLAQRLQDPALLLEAEVALGYTSYYLGNFDSAREHVEQGIALYDPQQHPALALLYGGVDPGMICLCVAAQALWTLGYPDQALKRSHEAIILAQQLSHPHSLAFALGHAARVHQFCQDRQAAYERAEAAMILSTEHRLSFWLAWGTVVGGWALVKQGQKKEGIAQIHQGLTAHLATGAKLWRPYYLALLAEAYENTGRIEEGLTVLAEALAAVDKTQERYYEAELYRLKGELTLQQEGLRLQAIGLREKTKEEGVRLQAIGLREKTEEAEGCFFKAIEIAQRQQAKSLELRAVMSLARLRQQQGKKSEACNMLAAIYNWFTEGFDTVDLKEAKALLEELSQ
ncbi:MAG: AAA family ATPase [Deltaproteobacteria bacterium]|nr:AAA family ATPase [Deltaproteobacteria bacterium]